MKSKRWMIYLGLSLVLFFAAFYAYPYFQKLVYLQLNNPTLMVFDVDISLRFRIVFALAFGMIPLFTGLVSFLFQTKGKYTYIIYLSMLISMIIFWQVRILNLNELLKEQAQKYGEHFRIQLPVDQMQVETFMFVGSMIGCIIAALFLKRLQKKNLI